MTDTEFNWRTDAFRSYELALAAKREQLIREGVIAPQTDEERAMAEQGPVDVPQMQAGRR